MDREPATESVSLGFADDDTAEFEFWDEQRWTLGLMHSFSPSMALKADYPWDDRSAPMAEDMNRFLFQVSYGC